MQHILIATRNSHKTKEIRQMLGGRFAVADLNARDGWPEIEETADTFAGNAALKAVGISIVYEGLVLADDSGLEVDAIGGAPGVWSARYAGENATDADNRVLLLKNLNGKPSAGRFRCSMVVAKAGVALATFDGAVEGMVINEERGAGGFGYDSMFIPNGFSQTFGELPAEIKNQLSHRARALEQAIQFFARL